MASFVEVERLALALNERERASLAAKLIESLPANSDNENGTVTFKTVNSSMLRSVRYDPKKRVLDVNFRTGEKYRYLDVPADEFKGLMNAKSHGRYMQTHIIDLYEVEKLED